MFIIKQIKQAKNGSNPIAINIDTGIATAVPYPATPSKKFPNPHATSNTIILLSEDTFDKIFLIVSISF